MFCASLLLAAAIIAQAPAVGAKKVLDHSVYDGWKSIRGTSISNDGKWLLYVVAPQEGDANATIRNVADGSTIDVPRASSLQFTFDSKYAVGMIAPPFLEARKARRDKVKPEDQPKSALVIVDLKSGSKTQVDRVASFQLPEEGAGWLLYKPEPPKPEPPKPAAAKTPETPATTPEKKTEEKKTVDNGKPKKKADHKPGDIWILRNLATGAEEKIPDVVSARFSKTGTSLAYSLSTKDGSGDGVKFVTLATGAKLDAAKGLGHYPKLALSPDGTKLAFTTDREDYASKKPAFGLYLFDAKAGIAKPIGADSLPKGWSVNEGGSVEFSKKGTRLLYSTSPKAEPDPEEKPDDEKVSVDVWTYKDAVLQPQQLLQAKADRERGYAAAYDLATGKSVQLADKQLRAVQIGSRGDGPYALGVDGLPYQREGSWDPGYEDVYLVDVKTGTRRKVLEHVKGTYSMGPAGRYLAAYVSGERKWYAIDMAGGQKVEVDKGIPFPIYDEENDVPDDAGPYGTEGWTANDDRLLIQDRYDIWACDPSGKAAPVNLTNGRGRSLRFSRVDLDPDEPDVNPKDLLLTALNDDTKKGGIFQLKDGKLTQIALEDKFFAGFQKAKDAGTLVYTRQDFVEFPDLWLTNASFADPKKITDANPQQKEYNWGKAELVRWTSLDGVPLQGILIKPEDFDYGKKYPMIAYFYERLSDEIHRYHPPAPSASTINLPLFASNGYCIFIPDIPYKSGYPGGSALSAIVPGVQSIVSRGYVDPKRLGIQGQSWGGYQTAFLVTQTDMFAAAEAGAPVANMISAYGGIRYGSGLVREMQYEHGQSRIGATPWEATLKYIENSPLFWLDRVKTPLMIMSNDKDGAVPHTQGIELFTGLRRLGKPAWMVVYNGEDHNIMERKNRKDFSVRLSQFFDHFLKGAPMPKWMSEGIPATDKGRAMGLETGG